VGYFGSTASPENVVRELKPTLRNGFRQGREPPLHYLNSLI